MNSYTHNRQTTCLLKQTSGSKQPVLAKENQMSAIIYKITNTLNGKSYIGFTIHSVEERWKKHCMDAHRGGECHFHRAIRKYDKENFEIQIMYEGENENWTLEVVEPFFISLYNTMNEGYNSTIGGRGLLGYNHTEETKQKISNSQKGEFGYWYGKKMSKNIRQKMSESHKKKTFTKEHKKNISLGKLGKPREDMKQRMLGKKNPSWIGWWITPLGKFESIGEAASKHHLTNKVIRSRCRHKMKFPDWVFMPKDLYYDNIQ